MRSPFTKSKASLIKRMAFTLAEVLIVLGIVGIIAEMTIPTIVHNTQNQVIVVSLKKVYSVLSQASTMILSENGDYASALSGATKKDDLANLFIAKMRVQKNCGTYGQSSYTTGCFASNNYKYLKGSDGGTMEANAYWSRFITSDGMSYAFALIDANCATDIRKDTSVSTPLSQFCGFIRVDVNGPNRGTAQYGRDTFDFEITKSGIYPKGVYEEVHSNAECSVYGLACANKVLMDGAINY